MAHRRKPKTFPDAVKDMARAKQVPDTPQTRSPAYRLAFADPEFLTREELRPVRLQLELLKPELTLSEHGIESTIVLFGGARIPDPALNSTAKTASLAPFYAEARRFAALISQHSLDLGGSDYVICTGGGPGVMEAGNRGASDVGGISIALNIVLPHEQAPNAYVTPDLCFNFHYFAIRKMHFLTRAKAVVVFPGGFGTLDELFETLTLVQTGRMKRLPILLFGESFWRQIIDWEGLAASGTINATDLDLFRFVETADEAFNVIRNWPVPAFT